MLIDGGNRDDSSRIYSILQKAGIEHLDIVVATHSHEDYIGGLSSVFSCAAVDLILSPVLEYESEIFHTFKSKAEG